MTELFKNSDQFGDPALQRMQGYFESTDSEYEQDRQELTDDKIRALLSVINEVSVVADTLPEEMRRDILARRESIRLSHYKSHQLRRLPR